MTPIETGAERGPPIGFGDRAPGAAVTIAFEACAFELAWCPPGRGVVGSSVEDAASIERPRQPIRLTKGFWIATTPITRRQWEAIVGSLPPAGASSGTDDLPASGISWDAARDFCRRLTHDLRSARAIDASTIVDLPAEAEWEYGCRAGTEAPWFFGRDASALSSFGWFSENSADRLHSVGLLQPNPWGLRDLYGSVGEWCLDIFRRYEDVEIVDPLCLDDNELMRIVRGGDFTAGALECSSAARAFCNRDNWYKEPTGVRPVLRSLVGAAASN